MAAPLPYNPNAMAAPLPVPYGQPAVNPSWVASAAYASAAGAPVPAWPIPNSGQWSTGFYDCCGEVITPSGEVVGGCSLCCKACFCSCCVVGDNSEYMSNGEGVYCAGQGHGGPACLAYLVADVLGQMVIGYPCGCLLHMPLRAAVRRRYGLKEEPCNDCCAVCFCGACSMVQEHKVT